MASFNKITLVGYLGRDPELRFTPNGDPVCNFTVATTEKKKNVAGHQEDITTWFRVTSWGRQAEACNEYLAKGKQVYVEGKLRLETYTNRDGTQGHTLSVSASDVQFLSPRDQSAPPPTSQPASASGASASAPPAAVPAYAEGGDDPQTDEVPF